MKANRIGRNFVSLTGIMLVCTGMAVAQSNPPSVAFITRAMQINMAEISLAHLALRKTANPQVKEFAQRMIHDHTDYQMQLKPVAARFGVPMPRQVTKQQEMMKTKLAGLSGSAFDQTYAEDMVKGHQEALEIFQQEAKSGDRQVVLQAAVEGQNLVSQHLQLAQQLAGSLHATGR